ERIELSGKRLPFGLMVTLEQALLHGVPSKVRAIPLIRLSAWSAGVLSGSARIAANSCRRSADRLVLRSAKAISATCSAASRSTGDVWPSTSGSTGVVAGFSWYTTSEPAARSPNRLKDGWLRQQSAPRK